MVALTGTPITGLVVIPAMTPGKWAAPPAPAIKTSLDDASTNAIVSCGVLLQIIRLCRNLCQIESTFQLLFMISRSDFDPIKIDTLLFMKCIIIIIFSLVKLFFIYSVTLCFFLLIESLIRCKFRLHNRNWTVSYKI